MNKVAQSVAQWESVCTKLRGRVLVGSKAHYCSSYGNIPVDETTYEYKFCECFVVKPELNAVVHH